MVGDLISTLTWVASLPGACHQGASLTTNNNLRRSDDEMRVPHFEPSAHNSASLQNSPRTALLAMCQGSPRVCDTPLPAPAPPSQSALVDMFWAALVIVLVRILAICIGSWLGCFSTGTITEFRRVFWMSMVTQAGVALGLARLAGTRFPDWGPHFQTFMVCGGGGPEGT